MLLCHGTVSVFSAERLVRHLAKLQTAPAHKQRVHAKAKGNLLKVFFAHSAANYTPNANLAPIRDAKLLLFLPALDDESTRIKSMEVIKQTLHGFFVNQLEV